MVRVKNLLFSYMAGSVLFVSVGALLLHVNSLVPVTLTYATTGAVIILAVDAAFVYRDSRLAINLGVVLSIAAILSSLASPAHLHAMTEIMGGGLISLLDILEILGFYLFPVLYIVTRFTLGKTEPDLKPS